MKQSLSPLKTPFFFSFCRKEERVSFKLHFHQSEIDLGSEWVWKSLKREREIQSKGRREIPCFLAICRGNYPEYGGGS